MPKLNPDQQKKAEEAKDEGFELLPEGRYLGQLTEVTQKPGNEDDYWEATFKQLTDPHGKKWPGRQWDTISLGDKSAWKQKQFFNAFGYTLDSDTDEMIGEWCVLYIGQEVAKKGKRAGELRNVVERLAPYDPDEWGEVTPGSGASTAGSGGDDF